MDPILNLGDDYAIDEDGDRFVIRHKPSGAEFEYNPTTDEWNLGNLVTQSHSTEVLDSDYLNNIRHASTVEEIQAEIDDITPDKALIKVDSDVSGDRILIKEGVVVNFQFNTYKVPDDADDDAKAIRLNGDNAGLINAVIDGNRQRTDTGFNVQSDAFDVIQNPQNAFAYNLYIHDSLGDGFDINDCSNFDARNINVWDCAGNGIHLSHSDHTDSTIRGGYVDNCPIERIGDDHGAVNCRGQNISLQGINTTATTGKTALKVRGSGTSVKISDSEFISEDSTCFEPANGPITADLNQTNLIATGSGGENAITINVASEIVLTSCRLDGTNRGITVNDENAELYAHGSKINGDEDSIRTFDGRAEIWGGSANNTIQFGTDDNVAHVPGHGDFSDNGARNVINGVGENDGNPGSTGDWNGNGYEGATVIDTTNNHLYVYRNGVWRGPF